MSSFGWRSRCSWVTGIGAAARVLAVHPVRVSSGSMAPAAEVGDWLVVSDLDGRGGESVGRRTIVVSD